MNDVTSLTKEVSIRKLAGGKTLSGALRGQELLGKLLGLTVPESLFPVVLFLDFRDVEIATASYLRESILAFRDLLRGRHSAFYPVLANANDIIMDDLRELLRSRGGVVLSCDLSAEGEISNAKIVGELDSKQRATLDFVRTRRETDAKDLMNEFGESEGVGPTAWNNRLASLVSLGLVVETSSGRTKRYRPVLDGV